jgi:DNA-directed RNA polymerase specialized sigma24 family protein
MTVREYLSQGYMLEQRIACDMRKAEAARTLAASIPSPRTDGIRVNTSPSGDAPFVRVLERVEEMEAQVAADLDLLLSLKDQMEQVIRSVPGEELRLLLFCRYMEHKTWPDIAMILNVSRNTAHSWHKTALEQVVLPESAIDIRSFTGSSALPAPAC